MMNPPEPLHPPRQPPAVSDRIAGRFSAFLHHNISLTVSPLLQPMSADDEAQFAALCQARSVSYVRLIALLSLTCAVLWMPADRLIYPAAQEDLRAVTLWRVVMILASGIALLLIRRPRFAAYDMAIFTVTMIVCCTTLGYSAGWMGGLDEPWFHLYYVMLFLTVLFPWTLGRRALMTLLVPLSLWSGLLLGVRGELVSRYLPLVLSVQLNVYLLSVVFGHGLFMLHRQSFLQSRIIAQNADALRVYSASLEGLVAARTVELRRLLASVETAREQERAHIARELHDELGQQLAALGYEVTALQRRSGDVPRPLAVGIEDVAVQLEQARRTVRSLLTELRPRVLDDLGLCAAIEWLVGRIEDRAELRCQIDLRGEEVALPAELTTAVFRIAQESLTNVLRHAEATEVLVTLHITSQQIDLRVRDNGRGLPPATAGAPRGVGLIGMRERVSHLGGRLSVTSAAPSGTEVVCQLPVPAPSPRSDEANT
ncbi:MAG: sensor histidine kinase [Myxococcales bacterium]|nr:sensor histidine kinase [Myxococcales bacterium]